MARAAGATRTRFVEGEGCGDILGREVGRRRDSWWGRQEPPLVYAKRGIACRQKNAGCSRGGGAQCPPIICCQQAPFPWRCDWGCIDIDCRAVIEVIESGGVWSGRLRDSAPARPGTSRVSGTQFYGGNSTKSSVIVPLMRVEECARSPFFLRLSSHHH